jgi:hypothetical protein
MEVTQELRFFLGFVHLADDQVSKTRLGLPSSCYDFGVMFTFQVRRHVKDERSMMMNEALADLGLRPSSELSNQDGMKGLQYSCHGRDLPLAFWQMMQYVPRQV